jgi:hypothetical protein
MNYYEHNDRPAVGLCGRCLRGLCKDCAAQVGTLLACRGRCEDDVARNSALRKWSLDQQKLQGQRVPWSIAAAWGLTAFGFAFGLAAYYFQYTPDVVLGARPRWPAWSGCIHFTSTARRGFPRRLPAANAGTT